MMGTGMENGTSARQECANSVGALVVVPEKPVPQEIQLAHPAPPFDISLTAVPESAGATETEPNQLVHDKGRVWGACILFVYEFMKAVRVQWDCGLYGKDWRIVYGGSSIRCFGPFMALVIRFSFFITHLVVQSTTLRPSKLLFFTTWTNLAALFAFFSSLLISIAAILSLGRERQSDAAAPSSGHSGVCAPFRYICLAEEQYRQLVNFKSASDKRAVTRTDHSPRTRTCFTFSRPFTGSHRFVFLETLLVTNDILFCLVLPMTIITFIVYWTMVFPYAQTAKLWLSVYNHLFTFVACWLLCVLSRFPYRLSLCALFLVVGFSYMATTAVAQSFGCEPPYWFLDIKKNVGLAIGVSFTLGLVAGPLFASIAFLVLHQNTAALMPPRK